jgi:hypothetical protein
MLFSYTISNENNVIISSKNVLLIFVSLDFSHNVIAFFYICHLVLDIKHKEKNFLLRTF